jgi:ABC-2 type transport system ATP-binding protein
MIVVENLSKSYGSSWAIEKVNFHIKQGEAVGLLGLNGAGKSTILKIVGSLMVPSGGTATVGGHSVTDDPQAVRKIIGYLPDTPPLYDEMTTTSYLKFVAALKDVPSNKAISYIGEAMERTNLGEVANSKLSSLSHGFRQRVGIAQALVHKPQVLVLDEPINGLDPVQIVDMRDLIKSLKGDYTVVLSSHILSEITKTCDRVLIMDHGKLVAEGSETSLMAQATKSMKLILEVEKESGLEAALKAINGVKAVAVDAESAVTTITVETTEDVRKEVSEKIVSSGAGLLSMNRSQAGLEGIFMEVVKNSEGGRV